MKSEQRASQKSLAMEVELYCEGMRSVIHKPPSNGSSGSSRSSDGTSKSNSTDCGTELTLWNNDIDVDLWICSSDVRNSLTLSSLEELSVKNSDNGIGLQWYILDEGDDEIFEDLMIERFSDLLDCSEEEAANRSSSWKQKAAAVATAATAAAVAAAAAEELKDRGYTSSRVEVWVRPTRELYVVPENWQIPESITLPMTKKEYDVIVLTAKNIHEKGSQFEIFLKVKEADKNPLFDFLNPDSNLFPFFQHIKSLVYDVFLSGLQHNSSDEITSNDNNEDVHKPPPVVVSSNALALLGAAYGDDDDDDDHDDGDDDQDDDEEKEVAANGSETTHPSDAGPSAPPSNSSSSGDADTTWDRDLYLDQESHTDVDPVAEAKAGLSACDDLLDEDVDEGCFWGKPHRTKKAFIEVLRKDEEKKRKQAERLARAKALLLKMLAEPEIVVDNRSAAHEHDTEAAPKKQEDNRSRKRQSRWQ